MSNVESILKYENSYEIAYNNLSEDLTIDEAIDKAESEYKLNGQLYKAESVFEFLKKKHYQK